MTTHYVFSCDACGQRIRVAKSLKRSQLRCPSCTAHVRLDTEAENTEAVDERDPRAPKGHVSGSRRSSSQERESAEFIDRNGQPDQPKKKRRLSDRMLRENGLADEADYDEPSSPVVHRPSVVPTVASQIAFGGGILLALLLAVGTVAGIGSIAIDLFTSDSPPGEHNSASVPSQPNREPIPRPQPTGPTGYSPPAASTLPDSFLHSEKRPLNLRPNSTVSVAKRDDPKPRSVSIGDSPGEFLNTTLLNSFEELHGDFSLRLPKVLHFLGESKRSQDGLNVHLKLWSTPGGQKRDDVSFSLNVTDYEGHRVFPGEDSLAPSIRDLSAVGYFESPNFDQAIERLTINGLSVSRLKFRMVSKSGRKCTGFTAIVTGLPRTIVVQAWSPGTMMDPVYQAMQSSLLTLKGPTGGNPVATTASAKDSSALPPPGPPLTAEMLDFDAAIPRNWMISAHGNRHLILLRTPELTPIREFGLHDGRITSVSFHPFDDEAVSTTDNGTVYRWDLKTFELISQTSLHRGGIRDAQVYGVGTLVTCGDDKTIQVASLQAEGVVERKALLIGHAARVNCAAVSRNGRLILSGSDDGTARLWDARQGEQLHEFHVPTKRVSVVAINDLMNVIATAYDSTVVIWDKNTREEIHRLKCRAEITTMQIFPNGKYIAIGGKDKTPRVWNIETQSISHEFAPHRDQVLSLKLFQNGAYYFSVDITGNVQAMTFRLAFAKPCPDLPWRLARMTVPLL